MKKSRNSLSGQNRGGRIAGTGSSPVSSTKSQRTKLWQRLRKLDRQIQELTNPFSMKDAMRISVKLNLSAYNNKIIKLDQKRKEIRNKLKGYKNESL